MYPSLSNFVEGLHDQLWKAFLSIPHNSIDYLKRVQDENALLRLCDNLLDFFNSESQHEYSARMSIIKLTYLYYKNDTIYD